MCISRKPIELCIDVLVLKPNCDKGEKVVHSITILWNVSTTSFAIKHIRIWEKVFRQIGGTREVKIDLVSASGTTSEMYSPARIKDE